MSNHPLTMATALGSMQIIKGIDYTDLLPALGITDTDYSLVIGHTPWVAAQRARVRQTLDTLAAGVMDITGVPRFEMPAEFYAALIISFVSPINMQMACRWLEGHRSRDSIAGLSADSNPPKPEVVFCFVCDLYTTEGAKQIRAQFEKNVGLSIQRAIPSLDQGGSNGQSKASPPSGQRT